MEQERCAICGAVISDNNASGIGFGCMANVVKPAQSETTWKVYGLEIWIEYSQAVRARFLEEHKEVKFRSEFKKNFYESMSKNERISKKQLEIMLEWLSYKFITISKKPFFENYLWKVTSGECREVYLKNLDKHKKLYLNGRKNMKEE